MRLSLVKSKNTIQFYVIQSYRNKNGKNTSKIFEKLGNLEQVTNRANGQDPFEWAKKYIHELNVKEKNSELEIIFKKSTSKLIPKNCQTFFNGGYLFLEKIYYELGLNTICKDISQKYKFTYDLNSILSRLIYSRIIYPSSKLATFELSKKYIEQPNFELHDIYRALEVISKETDFIQSELYMNSLKISKRNTNILYYDCTNYFFEIEQESGLRQYGPSKEHRPGNLTVN